MVSQQCGDHQRFPREEMPANGGSTEGRDRLRIKLGEKVSRTRAASPSPHYYECVAHLCIGVAALSAIIMGLRTASWSNMYRDSSTSRACGSTFPGQPQRNRNSMEKIDANEAYLHESAASRPSAQPGLNPILQYAFFAGSGATKTTRGTTWHGMARRTTAWCQSRVHLKGDLEAAAAEPKGCGVHVYRGPGTRLRPVQWFREELRGQLVLVQRDLDVNLSRRKGTEDETTCRAGAVEWQAKEVSAG